VRPLLRARDDPRQYRCCNPWRRRDTRIEEIDEGYHGANIGTDAQGNLYVVGPDAMRRYSSKGKLDATYGPVKLTGDELGMNVLSTVLRSDA